MTTGLAPVAGPAAAPASADLLRRAPKAELHCHLEGSVPAEVAVRLARRHGVALPTTDPGELYRYEDLEGFLAVYTAVSRALVTPADLAEVTHACLVAAAAEGLRYREMSFNPTNHPTTTYRQVLDGVLDGVRSARAETGVDCRLVVAVNREQPPSVALDLVRAALEHRADEVVAVGLDHNELVGPPAAFAEAFALAARGGLHRTAHAGERGNAAEVAASLDALGAQRIDHGYAVLADPGLLARCRTEGVHFATCWSTQMFHGGDGSAIAGMLHAGLAVSVNPDDPPMFGTSTGEELARAGTALGWTPGQAQESVLAAVEAAFCDETDRAALAAEVRRGFAELLAPAAG
ncbi:adenosine deaminase [Kineococcus sp. SYSU DK018]|uniref:adenosine deaminase n=1 Tax=Kineococcus sp. SYSU DK018 TaxID=3383139 RepID=UPI003D7E52A5